MSKSIAVIAPHVHGNGITTVAAMVAAELSNRNKKVCMSHVRGISESFLPYFSLSSVDNANAKSFATLVMQESMDKNSVPDYCRSISDNLDLFSLSTDQDMDIFTEEETLGIVKFMLSDAPYDFIVYDVDINDPGNPCVSYILNEASCVLLVVTQALTEMRRYNETKRQFLNLIRDKTVIVINKYDRLYGKREELAAQMGIKNKTKMRDISTIAYNRYVPYCENKGNMVYLLDRMKSRQAEVAGLDSDVKLVTDKIMYILKHRKVQALNGTQVKGD